MKEIISAVLLVVSIYGATLAIKIVNNEIRKAALEKASQGITPKSFRSSFVQILAIISDSAEFHELSFDSSKRNVQFGFFKN